MIKCSKCLLDSSVSPVFSLDENNICNYCNYYSTSILSLGNINERKKWLENKVNEIKEAGKNKPYDCILGVSGGTDSSYMAYWAKEQGLRPLITHCDNGWNSELAVKNIENICSKLQFELHTIVINWEEFKELQLAYLRAGVIDIEVLTDHAIYASILKVAKKYKIKYTLNGFNFATEAVMPKGWVFDKKDWENINDIYNKYGNGKLIKSYPHLNFYQKLFYHWFLKLESIQVLNYIDYNKDNAKQIITDKLGWKDYGGKHFESAFTKFYQIYILPTKFKVDKRKAHLSNLICSGQITKQEALKELENPLYTDIELQEDLNYVLKKIGMSANEFDGLMKEPARLHTDFKTEKENWEKYFKLIKAIRFWKK